MRNAALNRQLISTPWIFYPEKYQCNIIILLTYDNHSTPDYSSRRCCQQRLSLAVCCSSSLSTLCYLRSINNTDPISLIEEAEVVSQRYRAGGRGIQKSESVYGHTCGHPRKLPQKSTFTIPRCNNIISSFPHLPPFILAQ